jgi:hypothetical protein
MILRGNDKMRIRAKLKIVSAYISDYYEMV